MKSLYILVLGLLATQVQSIDYSVITLLTSPDEIMTVIVDNQTYPLTAHSDTPILFTGSAPASKHNGYRYAKINRNQNTSVVEPFMRPPVDSNTANEFFQRSWNQRDVRPLPVLYQPIEPIDRIQSNLHIDGQIPTLHIQGDQSQFDLMHHNSTADLTVKSNLTYISLNDTHQFSDVDISLSGRSSRWMPKLSYTVKLSKGDTLYHYRRIKLRALATDPSYIREQLAYDTIASVGLASSQFSFCRLFLNNQELGLFGVMETFQDPWLANVFDDGKKKYKDGHLYQGVFGTPESMNQGLISDLSFVDNLTAYEQGQYKIKAGKGKTLDFEPLMELTRFLNVEAPMNGTDLIKEWDKKFNTESFLRSMALEVLLGFSDGYLAMADNFYVYQEPDGKQFFYLPSDVDMTFGNTIFSLEDMWSGNYSTFPGIHQRPLLRKMLDVPDFKTRFEEILIDFTNNLINPTVMHDRIYGLYNMLQEDVAWDKSLPRVGESQMVDLNDSHAGSAAAGKAMGSQFLTGLNATVVNDMVSRANASIPFMTAVNGPTGHVSLAGVREWLFNQHSNTDRFFNSTPINL